MNKIQFDKLLKPLIDIYDEIELDLIRNVLVRLETYKSVQGSLDWYLEKLADMGALDRDNLKVIKKNKKQIEKVLKNIVTESGTHVEDLDTLNSYFEQGLINVNPKDLFKSVAINNIINEALKDTESIMRLIDTKAIESTKESYMKILNKTYIETASGVKTYTESIRDGIKEFAKEGIKAATYESGKTISIEAVVRRDVVTRMNKVNGDAELEHAKQMGTNLVYVDQHLGARVRTKYMKNDYEAHAEWQGKKYMLEGSSEKYPNFYETTGYGEMLGLKGINCYHNFRPTWEWEEADPVIDEVVNAKAYARRQKQRAYERKIRQLKRERLTSKDIDPEEYEKVSHKYKNVTDEFDKWLKENKLTRDYNREYVVKTYKESNHLKEVIKETKEMTSKRFQERTKGVKIVEINQNYSYFDLDEDRICLSIKGDKYNLIHELGHKLQFNFTKEELERYNKLLTKKFKNYNIEDFELINHKTESYFTLKNFDDFVSKYQTRIYIRENTFINGKINVENALEYFSEGIKYYYKDPKLLKEKDMKLFKFIESVIEDE